MMWSEEDQDRAAQRDSERQWMIAAISYLHGYGTDNARFTEVFARAVEIADQQGSMPESLKVYRDEPLRKQAGPGGGAEEPILF